MTAREQTPINLAFWLEEMRRAIVDRAGKRKVAEFMKRVLGRVDGGAVLDLSGDEGAHRYLWRLGLVPVGGEGPARVSEVLRTAAERASVPLSEAGLLVRMFSSGVYGLVPAPVCGDVPECTRCPFIEWCRYARDQGRGSEPPAEESFRERLRLGDEGALGAPELLSLVISGGRKEARAFQIAQRLLADAGSIRALARKSVSELEKVEGVGRVDAIRLRAALSLAVQWATEPRSHGAVFSEGRDFFRYYRPRLRDKQSEFFIVALLDQKNRLIGEVVTGGGGVAGASVDPRVLLTRALRDAAARVAFIHNHPSGDTSPSNEDMEITARLLQVCSLAGLKVLDHVIIGGDGFTSMAAEGFL